MNDSQTPGAEQAREIPTPPGGGSWTFDRERWEWVPNNSAPAEQAAETEPASAPEQPAVGTVEE